MVPTESVYISDLQSVCSAYLYDFVSFYAFWEDLFLIQTEWVSEYLHGGWVPAKFKDLCCSLCHTHRTNFLVQRVVSASAQACYMSDLRLCTSCNFMLSLYLWFGKFYHFFYKPEYTARYIILLAVRMFSFLNAQAPTCHGRHHVAKLFGCSNIRG
jgi:hypothetical protein